MTRPAGQGFPKAARVRRRGEYLALARTARRRHTRYFVVLSEPRAGGSRLGVTVSRKIGDAVVRNRLKRRLRELFRRHPSRLVADHDLVVIAKPGAGELGFEALARELADATSSRPARTRRT